MSPGLHYVYHLSPTKRVPADRSTTPSHLLYLDESFILTFAVLRANQPTFVGMYPIVKPREEKLPQVEETDVDVAA